MGFPKLGASAKRTFLGITFEKTFPPEREIDFKHSYPGKDDQSLTWHRLAAVTADGQCDVAASLGGEGANLFYAVSALYSPREQTVSRTSRSSPTVRVPSTCSSRSSWRLRCATGSLRVPRSRPSAS